MKRVHPTINGKRLTDVERIQVGMKPRHAKSMEEAIRRAGARPPKKKTPPERLAIPIDSSVASQLLSKWGAS